MAYDLEEQEQLAELKAWWNKYGNLLTWVLIAILAAYAGWNGWNYYQRNQAVQASQLYEEMQQALGSKDSTRVQRIAGDIQEKFGRTAYAQMAGLTAAKAAAETNDLKTAKIRLQWVVDHGNTEFSALAKIRMAGVLLDEKSYDDGLKLLSGDFPAALAGVADDRKGDIFVAQNKLQEARSAYQSALEKTDKKNPSHKLIQLKLDAIGGVAANSVG